MVLHVGHLQLFAAYGLDQLAKHDGVLESGTHYVHCSSCPWRVHRHVQNRCAGKERIGDSAYLEAILCLRRHIDSAARRPVLSNGSVCRLRCWCSCSAAPMRSSGGATNLLGVLGQCCLLDSTRCESTRLACRFSMASNI